MEPSLNHAVVVQPGEFEPERHFYPRVLQAEIHPLVRYFLSLGNERITGRYCHLHPEANPEAVRAALAYRPIHFRWGGADLFHVATERGARRIVVIETNSCPSGQKSMPRPEAVQELAGYRLLLERSFLPLLSRGGLPAGGLAVLYDKNYVEVSGYAAAMAQLAGEPVLLTPFFDGEPDPPARFTANGTLEVRTADGAWHPIRAAFRYVTQRPWTRIPAVTRTLVYNPVVVCLAGGRNKLLAAKAYDFFNAELRGVGLNIHTPETHWDVAKAEVPLWVRSMGGVAVVKVPYSNAGQGVYTITNEHELRAFMEHEHSYDRFIVQALIGNARWSSRTSHGRLYHVGTTPNESQAIYVADLRFMVGAGDDGFFPVAIYARRARKPLVSDLAPGAASWDMLGTNLSIKEGPNQWSTDTDRLLLMDSRDFNHLGVGLDDLIEGYLQTALAVSAIDRVCENLITRKGRFRRRLFSSLNPDPALVEEILL